MTRNTADNIARIGGGLLLAAAAMATVSVFKGAGYNTPGIAAYLLEIAGEVIAALPLLFRKTGAPVGVGFALLTAAELVRTANVWMNSFAGAASVSVLPYLLACGSAAIICFHALKKGAGRLWLIPAVLLGICAILDIRSFCAYASYDWEGSSPILVLVHALVYVGSIFRDAGAALALLRTAGADIRTEA